MKDYFGKDISELKDKKLYLLDMDGTVYLGNTLFDGVNGFLNEIRARGAKAVFITNNPSRSVKAYIEKLEKMGVKDMREENFLTSAQAAASRMIQEGFSYIYAQGTTSFIEELKSHGIKVTETFDQSVHAILVSFDTEITHEKMLNTCKMLALTDKPYFATNPDWKCPTEFGYVPDCGSMCESYYKATSRRPIFIGKPEPVMIYAAMQKFGIDKKDTVVIGDRIYTDIMSGYNAGVNTVCVLSGEVNIDDVKTSEIKPTFTLNSVTDIFKE